MKWKAIRLELARSEQFPHGSASRSYLLRLPLMENGLIDESSLKAMPSHAIVRRFWPNEPDRSGTVIPTPNGWAFSYECSEGKDESVFQLDPHPIQLGGHVTLPEPDGSRLPFRVASLREAE